MSSSEDEAWSSGSDAGEGATDQQREMRAALSRLRRTAVPAVETRPRGALHVDAIAAKRKEIAVSGWLACMHACSGVGVSRS